jgi:peroxiredoxin Q/BCP
VSPNEARQNLVGLILFWIALLRAPGYKVSVSRVLYKQGDKFMATIKEGDKAPWFNLKDKDGVPHALDGGTSDYTVLFFYPKDDTPGCTIEAKGFSAQIKDFQTHGVRVFGISGGSDRTKAKFCEKHQITVPLLSDEDFAVARSYGAFGDKKFMGRSFKGIFRKTFILDKAGTVVRIFDSVKPEGHAREVLAALQELRGGNKARVKKVVAKKEAGVKKKVATKRTASKKSAAKRAAKRPGAVRGSRTR